MKRIRISILALLLLLPLAPLEAAESHAGGFAKSSLWVSRKPVYDKASVKIYTVVFNPNQGDLRGAVEFYANGSSLGKAPFAVVSGGTQVVWVNWIAQAGKNVLSAKITDAFLSKADGAEVAVTLGDSMQVALEETVVPDPSYAFRENDTRQAVSGAAAPVLAAAGTVFGASSTIVNAGRGVVDVLASGYASADAFVAGIHDALDEEYKSVEGGGEASSTFSGTLDSGGGIVAGTSTYRAPAPKDSQKARGVLEAVYLFILATARFIFRHSWLLYFLIGAGVVFIFRMIFRRR